MAMLQKVWPVVGVYGGTVDSVTVFDNKDDAESFFHDTCLRLGVKPDDQGASPNAVWFDEDGVDVEPPTL